MQQINFVKWPGVFLLGWFMNLSWTVLSSYPANCLDGSREWTGHFKGPCHKSVRVDSKWSKMSPTCVSLERCKLEVLNGLSGQQKFWTRYLDHVWRSLVFDGRIWEESGKRNQYVVKFEVALTRMQMPMLWQKLYVSEPFFHKAFWDQNTVWQKGTPPYLQVYSDMYLKLSC